MKPPDETRILNDDEVRRLSEAVVLQMSEELHAAMLEVGIFPEDLVRLRSLAARFRNAREARKETLKETSARAKMPQYRIKDIEAGSSTRIKPDSLRELSSYFGLDEWCCRWALKNRDLAERLGMRAWINGGKGFSGRSSKGFSEFHLHQVDSQVKMLVESRRPPEHIRDKLDIGYRIEGLSFEIFELRPRWMQPGITQEFPVAKATYVKSSGLWKLYWMRSDSKWHRYDLDPGSESLQDVLREIEEDPYCCFWG